MTQDSCGSGRTRTRLPRQATRIQGGRKRISLNFRSPGDGMSSGESRARISYSLTVLNIGNQDFSRRAMDFSAQTPDLSTPRHLFLSMPAKTFGLFPGLIL